MRDNTDSSPEIIETRYRAGSAQDTLNIELGLAGDISLSNQSQASASAQPVISGSSSSGVTAVTVSAGGGSRLACFTFETGVGITKTKPFGEIKINDPVYAFDKKTKIINKVKVLDIFRHPVTELLRLGFSNGKVLMVRAEHQFYSDGAFRSIGSFKEGDMLPHGIDFVPARITSKHILTLSKPIEVFNLATSLGTYFVEGFPVSNSKAALDDTFIE